MWNVKYNFPYDLFFLWNSRYLKMNHMNDWFWYLIKGKFWSGNEINEASLTWY